MREIKFRIWDSDQGRVLPVITMYYDDTGQQWFGFQKDGKCRARSMEYCEAYNGDPTVSVMQFTGLHDKNGREIWEGDIVCWKPPEGTAVYAPVEYDSSQATFWMMDSLPINNAPTFGGVYNDWMRGEYEVIGNVHENPELLEGNQ